MQTNQESRLNKSSISNQKTNKFFGKNRSTGLRPSVSENHRSFSQASREPFGTMGKRATTGCTPNKPKVKLGEIFTLKINALGPKKMGLVELTNGLTVLVPNSNLGDLVKVKLEKILPNAWPSSSTKKIQLTNKTFILGSLVEVIQQGSVKPVGPEVGQLLTLTIKRKGPKNSGLASSTNDFPIIVPNAKVAETVQVKITKIKSNYAFATIQNSSKPSFPEKKSNLMNENFQKTKAFLSNIETSDKKNKLYHVVLPLNAMNFGNFFAFKLNGTLLFVKKSLGIELGDHILMKLLRIRETFSIAKVVKILQKTIGLLNQNTMPTWFLDNTFKKNFQNETKTKLFANKKHSPGEKQSTKKYHKLAKTKKEQQRKVKTILKKMILSSMHYGERAIRCNANMRSYVWLRKKGKNKNRPLLKRGRHIINLFKTYKSLKKVLLQLSKYAATGQTFLFVGTKKSASSLIARTAVLSQTSFFVNSRWLGGMLTNWKTILKSISQMKPILKEKQKVIQNLLVSRQRMKDRLLSKVNILRKKSRKLMLKGKKLIFQLQQNPNSFIEKNQFILNQRNFILIQNKNYIEKYSTISMKEQKLLLLMKSLKLKLNSLLEQKKSLKHQILNAKKELSEFKQLFLIGQELAKVKNSMLASGKTVWSISYEKFNQFIQSPNAKFVPNPSVDILNQIIAVYYKKLNFNNTTFNQVQLNESKSNYSKPIVLSKLLDKFLIYLPFMKKYLLLSYTYLANKERTLQLLNKNIEQIVENFKTFYAKAFTHKKALEILKSKLVIQQKFLKVLKLKLKVMSSEQRLLKFLTKLRSLPTTKAKMYQRVELLMKKFVDPKMSYVIDQIYDQKLKSTSKKMAAARKQKWQRLEKYFGGVTQMSKMSNKQISNNVAIIIGQQEEMNAVRECQKLGIKMFTVVDTNCNPKLSDHIIPANDDSSTSMEYILGQMLTYIRLAQKLKRKIS
jgi:small subunit ribosomal protein S2